MIRVATVAAIAMIAVAAVAQTVKSGADVPAAEKIPSQADTPIPEIPAGADPMERRPDPAVDTPAAKSLPRPAAGDGPDCRVRRADTDTGFVVVCEESG